MAIPNIETVILHLQFKYFWLKSVAIGFWFIAVGYYFLLFAYLFTNKFLLKETKLFYWLVFSLFFLFLGMGRVSNMIFDFYVPNSFYDQLGTGINWFSIACLAVIAGIMLVENEKISKLIATLIAIPPIIIGVIYPFVPPEGLYAGSALYLLFNVIILPIYALLIMALFIYLAIQIPGDIRKTSILNTIGFLILFAGRFIYSKGATAFLSSNYSLPSELVSVIASGLVIISLIIFAFSTR